MLGQRPPRGLLAGEAADDGFFLAGIRRFSIRSVFVFGRGRFHLFELEFQLVELLAALGRLAKVVALELGDQKPQSSDHCLCSRRPRLGRLAGQTLAREPGLQGFDIVGKVIGRRFHATD